MSNVNIGIGITYFREQKGLNVSQLAEKIGMSQGSISNYEKGNRNPSATTLEKISLALGVPIKMILTYAERANQERVVRDENDRNYLRKLKRKEFLKHNNDVVIEFTDDLILAIKARLYDLNNDSTGPARVGFNRDHQPSPIEAIFENVLREFLREHSDEITHRLYEELDYARMGIDDIVEELNMNKRR
jgi:transcriptional regulator with XRE-family HTH domain